MQTTLLETQTKYARIGLMPSFVISTHLFKAPPDGAFYNNDVLSVDNNGSQVDEFAARMVVHLELSIFDSQSLSKTVQPFVLNGYYSAQTTSASGTGRLTTFLGDNNNQAFVTLKRECAALARGQNVYVELTLKRYIRLNYLDRLGARHTDYFLVQPLYGACLLSQTEGESCFEGMSKAFAAGDYFEIDKLTASELMKRVQELVQKQRSSGSKK